jgi:aspartate aminotransferase-like enzyme
MGQITTPERITVLKARRTGEGKQAPWAPAPIDEVTAAIARERPAVVFAPHVETASGMMLPDDYVRRLGDGRACRRRPVRARLRGLRRHVGGHAGQGVDVLISAPQKGWSSSPCLRHGHASAARPR